MDTRYSSKMRDLIDAALDGPGEVDPAIRRSVGARVAAGVGVDWPSNHPVPDDIAAYVDIVATRAHETTDGDIALLLSAGYSENAVFETTVVAAVAAGAARMELGLAAVEGGST